MLEAILIVSCPVSERWRSRQNCLHRAALADQEKKIRAHWSRNLGECRQRAFLSIHTLDIADEIAPGFRTSKILAMVFFNIFINISPEATEHFQDLSLALLIFLAQAKPIRLQILLDILALDGRLLRFLAQNIDYNERRFRRLWERAVQIHGRIAEAKCAKVMKDKINGLFGSITTPGHRRRFSRQVKHWTLE